MRKRRGCALTAELNITVIWEDPGGVTAPELAATWARVGIQVGDRVVTQVLDRRADTVRNEIYVPLYPLAEWAASNWHRLLRESPIATRRNAPRDHNMRSGRDGFALPDMELWGGRTNAWCAWRRSRHESESVEFLAEGEAELPADNLRRQLADLVTLAVERLSIKGIEGTYLADEWAALQNLDSDEQEFCVACGHLGLDPFSVPESLAQEIVNVSSLLPDSVLWDFYDAADFGNLAEGVLSMRKWLDMTRRKRTKVRLIPELRGCTVHGARSAMPWDQGYAAASSLRSHLNLDGQTLSTWEALGGALSLSASDRRSVVCRGDQPSLLYDAAVGLSRSDSPVFVVPKRHDEAGRFAFCRALYEYLWAELPAMATPSHAARQKRNRAFAAEFLAPAANICAALNTNIADDETVSELAAQFGVSEFVIRHQIANQLPDVQLADW